LSSAFTLVARTPTRRVQGRRSATPTWRRRTSEGTVNSCSRGLRSPTGSSARTYRFCSAIGTLSTLSVSSQPRHVAALVTLIGDEYVPPRPASNPSRVKSARIVPSVADVSLPPSACVLNRLPGGWQPPLSGHQLHQRSMFRRAPRSDREGAGVVFVAHTLARRGHQQDHWANDTIGWAGQLENRIASSDNSRRSRSDRRCGCHGGACRRRSASGSRCATRCRTGRSSGSACLGTCPDTEACPRCLGQGPGATLSIHEPIAHARPPPGLFQLLPQGREPPTPPKEFAGDLLGMRR